LTFAAAAINAASRNGQNQRTERNAVSKGNSPRTIFTSAFGALALAAGLAAGIGGLTSRAHAEDAKASDPLAAGRDLFNANSCSACHTLADAGSTGSVGPDLDNPNLTRDTIVNRVEMGGGPMPSFSGQISQADIGKLADYIVAVNHKAAAPAPTK
jgi:mono/diheme cytochrome c family protein